MPNLNGIFSRSYSFIGVCECLDN